MAKKRSTKHECFNRLDKELEKYNTKLSRVMLLNFDTKKADNPPYFATEKSDTKKRGKAKTVFFSYCPICGKKLEE